MIDRYSRKEMQTIWSEENKYSAFMKVELMNAEVWQELGLMTRSELDLMKQNARFSLNRIKEIEAQTKHDVIAFTRAVSETLGAEKRFFHYGLTSTDVVDTANGLLLKEANLLIAKDIDHLMAVLKQKALAYKETPCIGRTHGIHAEVTVFGLKWALWYEEMARNRERFDQARRAIEVGKLSGAVGNYAMTDPKVEPVVLEKLGLGSVRISTQTLQRDRHAYYVATLALIGASLEKIATEIRHLQRTEVGEVEEAFGLGQKGSSAMPHKHNPISSENICGLARILRGYMIPAYENIALWHERDISHSSVERIVLADATTLLDYMLNRYRKVLDNLVVYPDKMLQNIHLTYDVIFSQTVLTALIDKGMSREDAYDLIQPLTAKALQNKINFRTILQADPLVLSLLNPLEIDALFDLNRYKKHVKYIFHKVFESEEG
ncbi:MAG: adenylosuccinate lyase [Candidatus Izemoplasmatales bacterium]|nr:adenylosuccinate lyase [Candidatus Izemoplasmatales bacterium]MDY0373397.1 adenylosuccinate lyase [Candidatus Izemoplasmatales bacterium]